MTIIQLFVENQEQLVCIDKPHTMYNKHFTSIMMHLTSLDLQI